MTNGTILRELDGHGVGQRAIHTLKAVSHGDVDVFPRVVRGLE